MAAATRRRARTQKSDETARDTRPPAPTPEEQALISAPSEVEPPVREPLTVEQKMDRWVERGVCPRAGHAIASHADLYAVPSTGNVQCRECRREIRRSYRAAEKTS